MAYKAASDPERDSFRESLKEYYSHSEERLQEEKEYGLSWYSILWKILRPVLIFLCSLVIVFGLIYTAYTKINNAFFEAVEPGNLEEVDFTIKSGASVSAIAQNLEDAGLVRNHSIFKYIIQFKGLTSKLQYGNYPLNKSMDLNTIIDTLCEGSTVNERTITIIPGWTVTDIANYLVKVGALNDTREFLTLCNDLDRFLDYSYSLQTASQQLTTLERRYKLEGYLSPDTYRIYMNAPAESIIQTLLKQNETVMDSIFNKQKAVTVIRDEYGNIITDKEEQEEAQEVQFATNLTQDETLILASIIEKEAGRKADYAKVSAVFHNRLEQGIMLESDATCAYPLDVGRLVLTASELATRNGYNTYTRYGLPVGPICNPSKAAIEAALYPDTEYVYDGYLYFCAGDPATGELFFSKTKEEHQANITKYRPLWVNYDNKTASSTSEGAEGANAANNASGANGTNSTNSASSSNGASNANT